jgi:2-amino-4-hydroxy-6-hydroxymethyldihydropteridine diphosphokinase
MPYAFIGIGSNTGDKEENCREAIDKLGKSCGNIKKISSVHITEPWGLRDQPSFVNMAVKIETGLDPEALLLALKSIESDMGREKSVKWGPRCIDLDILVYDDVVMDTDALTIPHPMLHQRKFALAPLEEIAPELVHPVKGKTIRELLGEVS